jgi:hypothetical protein
MLADVGTYVGGGGGGVELHAGMSATTTVAMLICSAHLANASRHDQVVDLSAGGLKRTAEG